MTLNVTNLNLSALCPWLCFFSSYAHKAIVSKMEFLIWNHCHKMKGDWWRPDTDLFVAHLCVLIVIWQMLYCMCLCFNRPLSPAVLRPSGLFLLSDSCMRSPVLLSSRLTRNKTRYHKRTEHLNELLHKPRCCSNVPLLSHRASSRT